MAYYVVKETSIATDDNPSFAGEVSIHFFGKDCTELAHIGSHAKRIGEYRELNTGSYAFKKYAYKRECDAKRSFIFRNFEPHGFWRSTVEIVKFDI